MTSEPQEARPPVVVPQHPGRRFGWVISCVWLLYLIDPLSALLGDPHPMWERVVGVALSAVFVFAYGTSIFGGFARMHGARKRGLVLYPAALLTIALVMSAFVGTSAATYVIFAVAAAVIIWPLVATVQLAVLAVLWVTWILPWLLGEPVSVEVGIITAMVSGLMFVIRRMQGQEAVIRRAHEDLAALAVDAERARFSRDLHDIVGHSLTAIIVKAELARKLAGRRPESVAPEVSDIERLARETLEDVRRTVAGYREVTLAGELASARAVLAAAGIAGDLPHAVDEVPGELRVLFGWVVREGVTNVVRHSRARSCRVEVTPVSVEVIDDGRGSTAEPGTGLTGLRERVAALGGTLTTTSDPAGGFRLRVVVPERRIEGETA